MAIMDKIERIMGLTVRRKCWAENEWFYPHSVTYVGDKVATVYGRNQDGIKLTICLPGLIWDFEIIAPPRG